MDYKKGKCESDRPAVYMEIMWLIIDPDTRFYKDSVCYGGESLCHHRGRTRRVRSERQRDVTAGNWLIEGNLTYERCFVLRTG